LIIDPDRPITTSFPDDFLALDAPLLDTRAPELDLEPAVLRQVLVIAFHRRTGSNLLCADLRLTTRAGVARGYLDYAVLSDGPQPSGVRPLTWSRISLPSPSLRGRMGQLRRRLEGRDYWHNTTQFAPGQVASYLRQLVGYRTTPNGVFALKVRFDQWQHLLVESGAVRVFGDVPLRFIMLTREDEVAQAISSVRAMQNSTWIQVGPTTPRGRYDPDAITRALEEIRVAREGWESTFIERGIEPIRIAYESFVSDRHGTVARVISALEGSDVASFEQRALSSMIRQADLQNAQWRERYLAEYPASSARAGGG